MLQQVFENKVRELRVQQGLSQDKLAFYCGIDRPQISRIEQGKVNVTLDTIEKLSPNIFCGEGESPKKFARCIKDNAKLTPVLFSDFTCPEDAVIKSLRIELTRGSL